MAKFVVASVRDIPDGDRKVVEVAGRSIGVFNVGGSFYAHRNRCPVSVVSGAEVSGEPAADTPGGRVDGPYVAETYQVSLDDELVVVEVAD